MIIRNREIFNLWLLQDAFSLIAYSNPWSSPLGWLLCPSRRESVSTTLNSAILGKSLNTCLETKLLIIMIMQSPWTSSVVRRWNTWWLTPRSWSRWSDSTRWARTLSLPSTMCSRKIDPVPRRCWRCSRPRWPCREPVCLRNRWAAPEPDLGPPHQRLPWQFRPANDAEGGVTNVAANPPCPAIPMPRRRGPTIPWWRAVRSGRQLWHRWAGARARDQCVGVVAGAGSAHLHRRQRLQQRQRRRRRKKRKRRRLARRRRKRKSWAETAAHRCSSIRRTSSRHWTKFRLFTICSRLNFVVTSVLFLFYLRNRLQCAYLKLIAVLLIVRLC